jgi:PAS domain S-box-containing protein
VLADDVVNGPEDGCVDWQTIRWSKVEQDVHRLRQRIFTASREGDLKKVRNLQKLMLRSRSNALLSMRRVTQLNAGRKTAGVDGQIMFIVLILIGVARGLRRSDRQQTEARVIRSSERRFRALVQKASEVIVVTDPHGALTYISPSVERVTGYSPGAILAKDDPFDLVHPDELKATRKAIGQALCSPGPRRRFSCVCAMPTAAGGGLTWSSATSRMTPRSTDWC